MIKSLVCSFRESRANICNDKNHSISTLACCMILIARVQGIFQADKFRNFGGRASRNRDWRNRLLNLHFNARFDREEDVRVG